MEILYKYISSIDYIKSFTFDYLETYSFQRGIDYEEERKLKLNEYDALGIKKGKQDLTEEEDVRYYELQSLVGTTSI